MKITYEFDPNEDKEDLHYCQNAGTYHMALWDITLAIRNYHKYNENPDEPEKEQLDKLKRLLQMIEDECIGLGYWENV